MESNGKPEVVAKQEVAAKPEGKKRGAKAAGQAQGGLAGTPQQSIREVFGYLKEYKNQTFVLKIDDILVGKPLFSLLIKDIVLLHKIGIRVVLVPGAKHSIDKVLKTFKVASPMQGDVRITSEEAMPLVKLGSSNVTNQLISIISENDAHGVVGNWVRARGMGVLGGVDYRHTGRVEKVDTQLVNNLLDDQFIPICPNIGWNEVGKDYNLSSSELAVAVAKALKASKLFFIGADLGIPVIPECEFADAQEKATGYFSNLDLEEGHILLRDYSASLKSEHRELVSLAMDACTDVSRVHVIDGSQDGILLQEIFSSTGHGTMFYANHYDKIRPAKPGDIPEILRIMQPYVDAGILLQRNTEDVVQDLGDFYVYKIDDTLHGCAALRGYPGGQIAELHALVVDTNYGGQGTGRKIVSFLLDKARKAGVKSVFLLTTQTSDFFMRNGFKEATLASLPPEKQASYNSDRNSRILSINL